MASQPTLKIRTLALLVESAVAVGALTVVSACASSPRSTSSRPVAPCAVTITPGVKARPIPSLAVPSVVDIPTSGSLYGVSISGMSTPFAAIGPAASKCTVSIGADGGSFLNIGHGPSNSISEVYVPGGAVITTGWACEYVPQVMAAAKALLGPTAECYNGQSYPYQEIVSEIATHLQDTFITTVVVPPGISDGIITSQASKVTTFAVFAVRMKSINRRPTVTSSPEISCELPFREQTVCKASIDYFAAVFLKDNGAEGSIAGSVVAAVNSKLGLGQNSVGEQADGGQR